MDLQCLEDTGPANFSLFEIDLNSIGIGPDYRFWKSQVPVKIVGQPILLQSALLELQVLKARVARQ